MDARDWSEIDNTMLDPQWYAKGDFHGTFKTLRDEDPIHWTEDSSYGKSYWAVSRYDDIKEYLLDSNRLSNRWDTRVPRTPKRLTPEERHELAYDVTPSTLDDPIHDLYRRPFNKHFSAPAIGKMRAEVERIVDEIIAEAAEKGGAIDVIDDLAAPLPAKVILRLLGVPEGDWEYLSLAAWQWLAAGDPKFTIEGDEVATSKFGKKKLLDYCAELAVERKKHPKDDFATVITNMTVDGDELSIHEVKSRFAGTIAGGMETTRNSAGTGLWLLLAHPEQRAKLLENPGLAGGAVDEVLRWSTPAKNRLRIANDDFEWHGRRIRAGDWVVGFLISANWDERVFPEPSRFDIERTPNEHLAFGTGIHLCLGRYLARLELATFYTKVLTAFPDLEIVDPENPKWIADRSVTGFTEMPARFNPSNVNILATA